MLVLIRINLIHITTIKSRDAAMACISLLAAFTFVKILVQVLGLKAAYVGTTKYRHRFPRLKLNTILLRFNGTLISYTKSIKQMMSHCNWYRWIMSGKCYILLAQYIKHSSPQFHDRMIIYIYIYIGICRDTFAIAAIYKHMSWTSI